MNPGTSPLNNNRTIPGYIERDDDLIIQGKTNASIILGRDRIDSEFSGYGYKASSIDLVVGRGSPFCRGHKIVEGVEERVSLTPLMTFHQTNDDVSVVDAARIYMSQRADIDDYLNLTTNPAISMPSSVAKSAIALKADDIRIVSNYGIRLITKNEEVNLDSKGQDIFNNDKGLVGIELIAGNKIETSGIYSLEPIVKAYKTRATFEHLADIVVDLANIMVAFIFRQTEFNIAVGTHTHSSPFFGILTSPSAELFPQAIKNSIENIVTDIRELQLLILKEVPMNFKMTHLIPNSEEWIGSFHNKTN